MSINTNIYGNSEQWYDAYYCQDDLPQANKRAYFPTEYTRSYLRLGVASGKLSYSTPLDKSLSYCGMGIEAPLSNFHKVVYNSEIQDFEIEKSIVRGVTNFAFAERNSNADFRIMWDGFSHTNDDKYCYWFNGVDSPQNSNYNLEPYTKIVPKNQVILILVKAVDNNFQNEITVDLSTYLSTYSTTKPNVVCVFGRLYFGDTTTILTRSFNAGKGDPNTWFCTPNIMILDKNNFTNDSQYDYAYSIFFSQMYNNLPILLCDARVSAYGGIPLHNDADTFIFGDKNLIKLHKNSNALFYPYIEYSNNFKEIALRATAMYGLFFTDRLNVAETGGYTNEHMYLGLIGENGITHGDYTRGSLNITNPVYNYNDMQDSGYDYQKAVDNTIYDNTTQFYLQLPSNAFTKSWVLTANDVSQLASELYTAVSQKQPTESAEEFNNRYFLCNNPLDCIVSLQKFPIQNILNIGLQQKIKLGAYETNVYANPLIAQTYNYTFVFDTSNQNTVYPVNGQNFLDYEPYTKAELTIPFCGTVEIPLTYIYDYDDLTVNLIIDFISGACTAVITAHGIAIDSISGKCAIDLPVSGIQKATLENQMHSVAMAEKSQQTSLGMGLIGGAVAIGLGIATGNLISAVGGATAIIGSFANAAKQGEQINYDLKHMEVPLKQISGASPAISQSMDMRAKLRITRPKISNEYDSEVYAKTVGFACLNEGKVSDFSGLTMGLINFEDSDIEATNEEKEMIKNYFANGVIL